MSVLGVDLGKTGCRAQWVEAGLRGPVVEGDGAAGLADPGGVDQAYAAVVVAVRRALAGRTPERLLLGAAGAEAAPDQAVLLAERLSGLFDVPVGVTSDSVTAHAGALEGAPGTVLAVGTGSVALGLSADGRRAQVDGWGPWLGDDGSGAWIGRAGLRAVLKALDGRGPATALSDLAVARFGAPALLPRTLHDTGSWARAVAAFAPDVVDAAAGDDPVAAAVLDEAVLLWVELAVAGAATSGDKRVAVVGGLASVRALVERFERSLPDHLLLQPAAGTPLDGALRLAGHEDLPHEAFVRRVRATSTVAVTQDVDVLATEQVRPDLRDLDARGPAELVDVLLAAEATVPDALAAARPALAAAVTRAGEALRRGGRLLYVGAGTPGRLAALDAAECPPTFGTPPDRVVAVLAGGQQADRTAVEGAEDDAGAGTRDLAALAPGPDDLVVGISASGRTPYVLAALEPPRAAGATTVAVVNNPGSPVARLADVAVELLTGPEVLAGSTRLKAGTAQKVTLNVLSTAAMVASGHTYGAWMVDVLASNEKLRRRARRILREAAGVGDAQALAALEAAGWRTKTALVALLTGVDADRAAALLDATGGRVREATAAEGTEP
jgi:N-acetylmuramic acid 6-phosphate etherase